ncbi:chemotaxis protein CheB [Saccharothrix sp. S26]|uniref:chemotaxis protein CheB n=1 Tax=Saccharothrix sp. S26 TaxID=2907215 RepID=UPI001F19AD54|nr:chemotaxis protein CheB [Saccharothrix sp. S26]MCE6995530.1 chemotaxis protein CheB [Saccharothrix sp. S26]
MDVITEAVSLDGKFPIVVLACSAGGLDAVSRVLAPLPDDFAAAIVVVQHMSPDAPDMLPEILARRTSLPVAPAVDGARLLPGHVLVASPGKHLLATIDGTLATIPADGIPPYRPSADLLLATLAVTAGPRVTAVVLSGRGNDAATGATAVHRFGGVVLAADPSTSTAPAMPAATIDRDGITDTVVDVDDMADLLTTLTTSAALRSPAEGVPG